MLWTVTIVCLVLAADVRPLSGIDPPTKLRLVLTPNASKILQRDNLLVRVVLENPQDSGVKSIEPPENYNCYYFEVQVRDGEEWRRIADVVEDTRGAWDRPGFPRPIELNSRYAEYNWFHRKKNSYIFERPGKYELRAVAQLKERELISDEVTITVGKRSDKDLLRAQGALSCFNSLSWTIHDEWLALQSLGGNINNTIKDFALVQEYVRTGKVKGETVATKDMCAELQRHMDPISWEYNLTLLGNHYVSWQDVEGLTYVVRAAPPFESSGFRDSASHLASFRRRQKLEEAAQPASEAAKVGPK